MQAAMQFSRWRHIQIRTENLNLEYHSEYQSENPENQTHSTVKVIWLSFPSHYLNPYSTSYNFLRAGLRKTASNKFKVHVTKKLVNFSWIRMHLSTVRGHLVRTIWLGAIMEFWPVSDWLMSSTRFAEGAKEVASFWK